MGISSLPIVIFLALKIALSTSSSVISGKGREVVGTVGAKRGISSAFVSLYRRFRRSISLFAFRLIARGRSS